MSKQIATNKVFAQRCHRLILCDICAILALVLVSVVGCSGPPPIQEEIDLVWPAPPEPARIKYVTSLSGSQDFKVSGHNSFLSALLGSNSSQTMMKPYGVAADATKVYVTDTGLKALWVFDQLTRKVDLFGFAGKAELLLPTGVCPGESGSVFVADSQQERVFLYDSTGSLIRGFGKDEELSRPVGIAYDTENKRLYVADSEAHRIAIFDSETGMMLGTIGERGEAEGMLNFPTNVCFRSGRLYVTDTGNFRVQIFDSNGKFISAFGEVGDRMGDFVRPKGIGVDSDGHIYVVDAAFDNFQIFTEEGKLLLFIGSAGHAPGQFWLPAGMWVGSDDKIFVVDSYNQRVQVFEYLPEEIEDSVQININ